MRLVHLLCNQLHGYIISLCTKCDVSGGANEFLSIYIGLLYYWLIVLLYYWSTVDDLSVEIYSEIDSLVCELQV